MKFLCDSLKLQKAVSIVEKSVPSRTSAPILENIYFSLRGNTLTLRGYDMEIGIEYRLILDQVELPGDVLVKSKTILGILSKLDSQELSISVDSNYKMKIVGEHVDYEILCLPPQEYPVLPQIEQGQSIRLKAEEVRSLIHHTIFSVSTDDSRKFLNGILLKVEKGHVKFVSSDGYRLSLKSQEIDHQLSDIEVIIPTKAVAEMFKIVQQSDPEQMVEISVSERQVAFFMPSFLMISRVLEGRFPDYRQLTPESYDHVFIISRRRLLDACERALIISSYSHNVVRFQFSDSNIQIKANASSFGDFHEEVSLVRNSGSEELKVAFNVKLVIDALRNMDSDDVKVSITHGTSPCLFEPASGGSYFYVVMPIRTNEYQSASPAVSVPSEQKEQPTMASGVDINPAFERKEVVSETVEVVEAVGSYTGSSSME